MGRLIGLFLIIWIVCSLNSLVRAGEPPVSTNKEEVKGFTMTLVDEDGRKKAVIGGSIANILPGGLIEILDVVARVYNPNNKTTDAIIHSSKGVYNRMRNIIDTNQFVRINRRDMVITGTGLHWEPDRAEIKLHRNVRVEYITRRKVEDNKVSSSSPNHTISAEEGGEKNLLHSDSADKLSNTNNPGEEDVATIITAEGSGKLDYGDGGVAVFRKNVEMNDKNANLKARLMKMFFNDQTQALTKVQAYGNVKIKQPKRQSSCRKAVYFVDEDKIVLSGNPRIVQGLDLYTAKKITIYDKGERVVFEPRAELVIYASTEHEEM